MNIPTLETERLILREVLDEDFPSYLRHFIDWEVIRLLSPAVEWPYRPESLEEFFMSIRPSFGKREWLWGITLKSEPNEIIGNVHLMKSSKENRGFWLARKHWKKGYMTEAVMKINDYAFNTLDFEVLQFTNAVGNEGSRRVKEKTGSKFVNVFPRSFVDPDLTEAESWVLTKKDWINFQNSIA